MDKKIALGVVCAVGAVLLVLSSLIPYINFCCMIWGVLIGFVMVLLYSMLQKEDRPVSVKKVLLVSLVSSILAFILFLVVAVVLSVFLGYSNKDLFEAVGAGGLLGTASLFIVYLVFDLIFFVIWFITSAIGGVVAAMLFGKK